MASAIRILLSSLAHARFHSACVARTLPKSRPPLLAYLRFRPRPAVAGAGAGSSSSGASAAACWETEPSKHTASSVLGEKSMPRLQSETSGAMPPAAPTGPRLSS